MIAERLALPSGCYLQLVSRDDSCLLDRAPWLIESWPLVLRTEAEMEIRAWHGGKHPRHSTGEMFAIMAGAQIIGVTGWSPVDGDPSIALIGWHAVAKSHRGRGLSREAFDAVIARIHAVAPKVTMAVEITGADATDVIATFRACGFEPVERPDLLSHVESYDKPQVTLGRPVP